VEREATVERERRSDGIAVLETRDDFHEEVVTRVDTELVTDEETVTVTREYDTSLPVDGATGRPPLKSEITRTRRATGIGRQALASGRVTGGQRESASRSARREGETTRAVERATGEESVAAEHEGTEKRGLNTWQRALIGTLALGCLALLGWKRLKSIFSLK
jgi:hypothetical protein